MYHKYYLSRRQTKSMSIDHPIGDPTGGAAYREMNDPVTAGIMAVSTIGGSLISSNAAKSAGKQQADAAEKAALLQQQTAKEQIPVLKDIYGNNYNYLNNLYNANVQQGMPYQYLGTSGANQLQDLTNSGYFSKQFGPSDLFSNLSPNYEFMKNQGLGAVTQQLNVGGGGSNIVRGATKFAEDYASNAYQNAFNNFQTQRTGIYNTLSGIANIGLNANTIQSGLANNLASNQTTLGGQLGTNITNLAVGGANAGAAGITGAAQANASGTVGSANALAGGVSSLGQTYALSQLLAPKTPIPTGTTPVSQTGIANPGYSGISVGGSPAITIPA
jgi:hypothetical protein